MDVGAVLSKLKPATLDHVDAWKKELNERKAEAI